VKKEKKRGERKNLIKWDVMKEGQFRPIAHTPVLSHLLTSPFSPVPGINVKKTNFKPCSFLKIGYKYKLVLTSEFQQCHIRISPPPPTKKDSPVKHSIL
jgi:hypothetical protein